MATTDYRFGERLRPTIVAVLICAQIIPLRSRSATLFHVMLRFCTTFYERLVSLSVALSVGAEKSAPLTKSTVVFSHHVVCQHG